MSRGTALTFTSVFCIMVLIGLALRAVGTSSAWAEDSPGSPGVLVDMDTCIKSRNALYVEYQGQPECLTYYGVGKITPVRTAIIFVGGDLPNDERLKRSGMFLGFGQSIENAVRALGDGQVPIIILGRPGLFGSTGDHRRRHWEMEYGLIAQAIKQLVKQLRLIHVGLVGQSGGSSAIMGAFSLGLEEGNCVVLGSGVYEMAALNIRDYEARGTPVSEAQKRYWERHLFSHHRSLAGIAIKNSRRFFLVGDSTDTIAPFGQQARYAKSLQRAGHSVRLVEVKSSRGDGHAFDYESLRAAARCLRGADDRHIGRVLGGSPRTP